jgi:SWI/SNF-related matrix-associated actin-dependent regulator 1 of chromatin subfamily A
LIEIDASKFLTKPYPYQMEGIKHIIKNPNAAIFDEMGVGKTKQIIDSACILHDNKEIEMVIVVTPASVQSVWDNDETGEIRKHCWLDYISIRYDNRFKVSALPNTNRQLLWITISYSFLRARLNSFLELVKKSEKAFLLVLDESSYVKSHKAQQTEAAWKLRQFSKRCVIANGTPIANSIMDLWAQFNILDPNAINNMNYFHYRAKYAVMKTEQNHRLNTTFRKIVGFKEEEVEDLKKQLAPWIIRREKKDVLKHLPPKLPSVHLEVPISQKAWKIYQEMKEEQVAWLDQQNYSSAVNAAVMTGRLSQITAGFMGGLQPLGENAEVLNEDGFVKQAIVEIDSSKVDAFLEWRESNSHLQVTTWCRFRPELDRVVAMLEKKGFKVGTIRGGQGETDRKASVSDFQAGKLTDLVANTGAGGFGLNLQNCYTAVYLSNTYSHIQRKQSEDRFHRNGQTMPISYYDILATSPSGGKTIDHLIIKALNAKEDLATWTVNRWKQEILAH